MAKVRFGLSNVHIAPYDAATDTFEEPVKVPGAVNLTADPQGDQTVFYADNGAYFTISTNAGYEGDLEMAFIPDELLAQLLGWIIDTNGALVEITDAIAKPFALLYEVQTDEKARRNVYYNCTLARPGTESGTTEDTTEVTTETYSIKMISYEYLAENLKITKLSIEPSESNKTVYDSFYNAVVLPNAEVSG